MLLNNELENGVFLFYKGNKDRFISHTELGKVIIGVNCKAPGYYKIKKFKDKEKVILAFDIEKVVYDYYDGIGYEGLKELLLSRGYKLGFEQPFKREVPGTEEITQEMKLVMYNTDLHMIVSAETIFGMEEFNTVYCYCYGRDMNRRFYLSRHCEMGCSNYIVVNLMHHRAGTPKILYGVEQCCDREFSGKIPFEDCPRAWTYADRTLLANDGEGVLYDENGNAVTHTFQYYGDKFFEQCPQELRDWFE